MVWRLLILALLPSLLIGNVKVGIDVLLEDRPHLIKGKRVGLISNQTAINAKLESTFELLKKKARLVAVFAPEHGYYGESYANEKSEGDTLHGVKLYQLNGLDRRPTPDMLKNIEILVFDVQDIGCRSYSFVSTLFYCMEEAAKYHIPVIVLDRPNPMGGIVVDGLRVHEPWRSFISYIDIPYCHGMTVGELALLFNEEYKVGCQLCVVPMDGWDRRMTFEETGLPWVPTSPQIPEKDTPFYYPATGLIGHCSLTSIGIGYTLPFKLVGAPWIHAEAFCDALNRQKLPGVAFQPFYFRPFFGKYKLQNCQGVRIVVTDPHRFLPVTTQYTVMGILKSLYPKKFAEALASLEESQMKRDVFNKLNGTEAVLKLISEEKYFLWKLRHQCREESASFLPVRKKYLIY